MTVFDEYMKQGEPSRSEKASIWRAAIGLQAVDGLETSDYLKDTARKHIEGEISIDQARKRIDSYYKTKTQRVPDDEEKCEADKASANITKILSSDSFDFSAHGYVALHRRIFSGIFKKAGQLRNYDITKKEWVLEGDTVNYLNWEDLSRALNYDIEQEKSFRYEGISTDELIAHITRFVSGIWQIHAFGEGNTRTTAVFTILFLRSIGFKVDNELFAQHSWYFRNALVRANNRNAVKGIDYTPVFLERFFRNLLLGEHWDLRNRYLHIHPSPEWQKQPNLEKQTSSSGKTDKFAPKNRQVSAKVKRLVSFMGDRPLSIKEMLAGLGMKSRESFMKHYLYPAMKEGLIQMMYPDSPRHPRQKYLLSVRGQLFVTSAE